VGCSKAYAMTGWRLGYLIAPKSHIRALQRLHQNFFISSNEFVQWAGVAALREAGADVRRFRAIFDERRRAMVAGLRTIGLGVGAEPTGAFYVFADARRFCERSYDFAFEILAGARVAVTPGIDFGAGGGGVSARLVRQRPPAHPRGPGASGRVSARPRCPSLK
jgi:aspartate/methionine/tyrosine aminotransferase